MYTDFRVICENSTSREYQATPLDTILLPYSVHISMIPHLYQATYVRRPSLTFLNPLLVMIIEPWSEVQFPGEHGDRRGHLLVPSLGLKLLRHSTIHLQKNVRKVLL